MSGLHGMVPMLVTPFDQDGQVDEASLRRLVAHQIEAGADGLGILGLAGEGIYLSLAERTRVTDIVIDAAGGVPVLVGCTSDSTGDACTLVDGASARGAAAVMVAPPRRPGLSADDARAHYRAVASAANCEVMVQDAPFAIGVELGVELVLELADELENVRSYKIEALPFWDNAVRSRAAAGDQLRVYGGHGGVYLMDVLDAGSWGLIPGADVTATLARAWRAFQRGDRDTADAEYRRVLPLLVYQAQSLGMLVGGAKTLLHQRGVLSTTAVRLPDAGLTDTTRARMIQIARAVGEL